jgi:hypothetical protein
MTKDIHNKVRRYIHHAAWTACKRFFPKIDANLALKRNNEVMFRMLMSWNDTPRHIVVNEE